jgi:hypothetical protein
MKKLILGLLILAGTSATFAKTSNQSTETKSIELASNMRLVTPETDLSNKNEDRLVYLGRYRVYVDGVYIGVYDVYANVP